MAIILTLIFFLTSIFAPGGGYSAIRTDDMLSINAKRILHEFKIESHRTDRSGRGIIILSDPLGDGKIYRGEANNLDGIRKATIQVGTPEKGIIYKDRYLGRTQLVKRDLLREELTEKGYASSQSAKVLDENTIGGLTLDELLEIASRMTGGEFIPRGLLPLLEGLKGIY